MLKMRWKSILRITKFIKTLKTQLLQEENIILKLQKYTPDYMSQKEKIIRITCMIKHSEQSIKQDFYMITSISSILARSTC